MGQAINDIRHMRSLAELLRKGATDTEQTHYSAKLIQAAADLDKRAELLSRHGGYVLL
jgi:hypothetical protein